MEAFAAWLEQSALSMVLQQSFVIYPVVNGLHVISIGMLFTSVLLIDIDILRAGKRAAATEPRLQWLAAIGFAGAVATGVPMFAIQAADYVENPAFLAKLALIAVAIVNFLAYRAIPARLGRPLALLSLLLWLATIFAGRFIGFL